MTFSVSTSKFFEPVRVSESERTITHNVTRPQWFHGRTFTLQ